jgi:hypothetical protein
MRGSMCAAANALAGWPHMPDRLREPAHGPDAMFSDRLPPTRGQYHSIAHLAMELLGETPPQNRLEATIAITRLRTAVDRQAGVP